MFFELPSIDAVVSDVSLIGQRGQTALITVAEGNRNIVADLVAALQGSGTPFLGGVFPGIINGPNHYDTGVVVTGVPATGAPMVIDGLDTGNFGMPDLSRFKDPAGGDRTAIILVDGWAPRISPFLYEIFNQLGNTVNFFGGGAGSLTGPSPSVFTNAGLHSNAAAMIVIPLASRIGTRHGWQPFSEPLIATRTDGNTIIELNWQSAFDVYRRTVEEETGVAIPPEELFQNARGYPFGIKRHGAEDIVRDPIAVDKDGSLFCVGEVPENAMLRVMKGDPDHLIAEASRAAAESVVGDAPIQHRFLADCVSRVLFLEEHFERELTEICQAFGPPVDGSLTGILTLGEIASQGDGLVEFLNKTTVAATLYA